MTPGVTEETADGYVPWKDRASIIVRNAPRALPILAGGGHHIATQRKTDALDLPTWSDSVVGRVVRLLLECP